MAYFVFDLDETLAEVYTLYYFLLTLRVKSDDQDMSDKLKDAYDTFVAKVLGAEQSDAPLGILRPGILGVMKELDALKREGKLKRVIIYSNNGAIENLEFIRDVIALSLGQKGRSELITDLIHWKYPGREEERTASPSTTRKTWAVLHKLITKAGTENPDFAPENVFFFDDFIKSAPNGSVKGHNIQNQLGEKYYIVPAYAFRASVKRVATIYADIISSFDIAKFSRLINPILAFQQSYFTRPMNNAGRIEYIVNRIAAYTTGTAPPDALPPPPDAGITMMNEAIDIARGPPPAAANGSAGGKRATRRKRARRPAKTRAKKKLKWRP
jgi:hypothetical protein